MTKIKVLDAEVVKRIAAGETLQRPMNAVKELIENSLDAGANRIAIHVQVPAVSSSTETSAGLFSIQVTDNGSGISKEDLCLLCERHATSKLVNVGDLRSVGTFGFRGEALASCSQVGRVEVVTRSREDSEEVAWKAGYIAGKMNGEPTPLAGNFGTIINVKDLFYGNRVRREALLNSSEEFQKIFQVIQAYALNQAGKCAFSLSKRRDRLEIQTSLSDGVVAVVKNLWGEELGGALLPFNIESDGKLGIEEGSGGWATRTTFHKLKSPQVTIFLNGRLIEHATLRRAMLQAFSMHLPTSPPAHPFIYLCLRVKGSRVDVNVHPSKKQVYFLDEGEIVAKVVEAIEEGVLRKQYETQNLKPIVVENVEKRVKTTSAVGVDSFCYPKPASSSASVPKISNLYPSQRVLTDTSNHRIDRFLYHSQAAPKTTGESSGSGWTPLDRGKSKVVSRDENSLSPMINSGGGNVSSPLLNSVGGNVSSPMMNSDRDNMTFNLLSPVVNKELVESPSIIAPSDQEMSILLDSQSSESPKAPTLSPEMPCNSVTESVMIQSTPVKNVLLSKANDQLCKLLRDSMVVGLIDSKWCLLQSGTNLMLCDMDRLNYELFYSLLAQRQFSSGVFDNLGLRVKGVFEGEEEEIGREAEEVLRGQVEFLREEFGIKFDEDDGLILSEMAIIITGQRCPSKKHLSTFIQRLCLIPDYTDNDLKRYQVLEELAMVYGLVDGEDWEGYVKYVILPAYRDQRAKYSLRDEFRMKRDDNTCDNNTGDNTGDNNNNNISNNSCDLIIGPPLQIITNTETLYKSFERC